MKVGELKELLKNFNDDLEIVCETNTEEFYPINLNLFGNICCIKLKEEFDSCGDDEFGNYNGDEEWPTDEEIIGEEFYGDLGDYE